MGKIGAGSTITVPVTLSLRHNLQAWVENIPEVVKEVVSTRISRLIAQDNARSTMVVITSGVHNQLLLGPMSKMWRIRWGCVPVRIGDEDVFVTVCSRALDICQILNHWSPLQDEGHTWALSLPTPGLPPQAPTPMYVLPSAKERMNFSNSGWSLIESILTTSPLAFV